MASFYTLIASITDHIHQCILGLQPLQARYNGSMGYQGHCKHGPYITKVGADEYDRRMFMVSRKVRVRYKEGAAELEGKAFALLVDLHSNPQMWS